MSTIQPSHQGLVQMAGWWGLLRLLEPLHIWGGFFVCTKRFIPTQFWWSRRQDQSSVSCGAAPTDLANLNCRPLIPYETKDTGQPSGSLRGSRGVGNQRVDMTVRVTSHWRDQHRFPVWRPQLPDGQHVQSHPPSPHVPARRSRWPCSQDPYQWMVELQLRCRRIWSSCSCPFPLLRPLHR